MKESNGRHEAPCACQHFWVGSDEIDNGSRQCDRAPKTITLIVITPRLIIGTIDKQLACKLVWLVASYLVKKPGNL